MCGHITRNITLQRVGDAEKGTVCPLYPRCTGRLHRQVRIFGFKLLVPLSNEHKLLIVYIYQILKCNVFHSPDPEAFAADLVFFEWVMVLIPHDVDWRVQYTEAHLYNQLTQFYRLLDASRVLDKVISLPPNTASAHQNSPEPSRFQIFKCILVLYYLRLPLHMESPAT